MLLPLSNLPLNYLFGYPRRGREKRLFPGAGRAIGVPGRFRDERDFDALPQIVERRLQAAALIEMFEGKEYPVRGGGVQMYGDLAVLAIISIDSVCTHSRFRSFAMQTNTPYTSSPFSAARRRFEDLVVLRPKRFMADVYPVR